MAPNLYGVKTPVKARVKRPKAKPGDNDRVLAMRPAGPGVSKRAIHDYNAFQKTRHRRRRFVLTDHEARRWS